MAGEKLVGEVVVLFGADEAEVRKVVDAGWGLQGVMTMEGAARARGAPSGDMDGAVASGLARCSRTRGRSAR